MKEIKLPELAVRSVYYDGYHAKVAFSKIKVGSVNYKILKAINEHPSYTRDQINTEVDGIEGHRPGYRSIIFTRMTNTYGNSIMEKCVPEITEVLKNSLCQFTEV